MLWARLVYGICFVLMGLGAVAGVIGGELQSWAILLGLGMVAWGAYDIHKYIREKKKEGEMDDMAKEREDIAKRLEDKE